jgi:hypothetical protein
MEREVRLSQAFRWPDLDLGAGGPEQEFLASREACEDVTAGALVGVSLDDGVGSAGQWMTELS